MNEHGEEQISAFGDTINQLRQQLDQILMGQSQVLEQVLVGLIASGHLLIEGVPGLGKTLLVRALSRSIGATFSRIQFTPDLMPSDVTGHAMFNNQKGCFQIRKGPIFTHFLLADEINRAPAKTQAALLEVMQEKQVTIEGERHLVELPFMVLATQNPIEQEGTYPLPEAELDRFLMKILIDYPHHEDEMKIVEWATSSVSREQEGIDGLTQILQKSDVLAMQQQAMEVVVDQKIIDYAVSIIRSTREWPGMAVGAGPRGSIGLIKCAKAYALLEGRGYVTPDDIKSVAKPVLRHRLQLGAELEIEGVTADILIDNILNKVAAP